MQVVATLIILLCFYTCRANRMAETLDINKPLDDEMFTSKDENDEGVPFLRIMPKKDYLIGKVIQDYNDIWQRLSYLQEAKYVDVYKRNDRPFLVAIKVVKLKEQWDLYFMNTISTWAPISVDEFTKAKSRSPDYNGPEFGPKNLVGSFTIATTFRALFVTGLYFLYIIA